MIDEVEEPGKELSRSKKTEIAKKRRVTGLENSRMNRVLGFEKGLRAVRELPAENIVK